MLEKIKNFIFKKNPWLLGGFISLMIPIIALALDYFLICRQQGEFCGIFSLFIGYLWMPLVQISLPALFFVSLVVYFGFGAFLGWLVYKLGKSRLKILGLIAVGLLLAAALFFVLFRVIKFYFFETISVNQCLSQGGRVADLIKGETCDDFETISGFVRINNKGRSYYCCVPSELSECDKLEAQVKDLITKANYCQQDSDCQALSLLTCPFGCYPLLNIQANLSEILEKIDQYKKDCTLMEICEYECPTAPESTDIKCQDGKCVDTRFETDQPSITEVSIATDKTEYKQGEIIEITINNNSDEKIGVIDVFNGIEKQEQDKWLNIWGDQTQYKCSCDPTCYFGVVPEIESYQSQTFEWNQKMWTYCNQQASFNNLKDSQFIFASVGVYRVLVKIADKGGREQRVFYSNQFEVKERVSRADELISDPYKYVWEEKEGKYGGMRRFFLDLNNDEMPELFLVADMLVGNAGGPWNIFQKQESGYRSLGGLNLHENGFWLLASSHYGYKDILAYWRPTNMLRYNFDGRSYILVSEDDPTSEALIKEGVSPKNEVEYSGPILNWKP